MGHLCHFSPFSLRHPQWAPLRVLVVGSIALALPLLGRSHYEKGFS